MGTRIRPLFAFVVLALAAMVAAGAPAQAASPLCGPGRSAKSSSTITTSDGATHTFYYRIPSGSAPPGGRPVFIWMHGDGGTGGYSFGSEYYPILDRDGTIVITPNGTNKTWVHAAGDMSGQPKDSQFISRIMDALDSCASVNHSRYFVGGHSRGAYMPYFLLQRSSTRNRIAGALVSEGNYYCQSGDPECVDQSSPARTASPARIMQIHGTSDTAVGPPPLAQPTGDGEVDWRVFFGMNMWAQQNGCYVYGDSGILRATYSIKGLTARAYDLTGRGAACSKYQLNLVEGGTHTNYVSPLRMWSFLYGIRCHGYTATRVGGLGNDAINGTSGRDVIVSFGGADSITAGGGDDVICAGDGTDTVNGGEGSDAVYGDGSDDTLYGADGNDKVHGDGGNDYVNGGPGVDSLFGGIGNDTLYAKDSVRDTLIDGGSGTDSTTRDAGDPAPLSVP